MRESFKDWKKPVIKHLVPTIYNWVVSYPDGLALGKYTDIGAFTYLQAEHKVLINENVEIGSNCSIYSKSTIDDKKGMVVIGKNSKVGAHSVIMPNVVIGENVIIGAFSFVNKNIPSNCLALGVPIKIKFKCGGCGKFQLEENFERASAENGLQEIGFLFCNFCLEDSNHEFY